MKRPSMKGVRFDVTYASGRVDSFFAKTSKHYEECKKDLSRARETGAVVSWKAFNPKTKEIVHA